MHALLVFVVVCSNGKRATTCQHWHRSLPTRSERSMQHVSHVAWICLQMALILLTWGLLLRNQMWKLVSPVPEESYQTQRGKSLTLMKHFAGLRLVWGSLIETGV